MLFVLLLCWIGTAIWAYVVGARKDRGFQGAMLGFFFGIFGVLAMYMIKGDKQVTELKSKVDQAKLRVELASLERQEYDAAMAAAKPSDNTLF
jgi:hypothetical protein